VSLPERLIAAPARSLRPDERELVEEWLALAGDIGLAYESRRHSDDPALRHRIVIACHPTQQPSYVVHAPSGQPLWLVTVIGPPLRVEQFETLRDALNSIRRVLD
jgi:hypothetical protein